MNYTFNHVNVKKELWSILRKELPKHNFGNVKVITADPRTPAEVPCIGINRIDDNESERTIADASGTVYDKDTGEYKQLYGTFFQESVELRVWHTNSDERDNLYVHLKSILFAIRPKLTEMGLLNISLRSGRDEQDNTMAQAPTVLYWAPITMSYLNPLDVAIIEPAETISAIYSNERGESSDG